MELAMPKSVAYLIQFATWTSFIAVAMLNSEWQKSAHSRLMVGSLVFFFIVACISAEVTMTTSFFNLGLLYALVSFYVALLFVVLSSIRITSLPTPILLGTITVAGLLLGSGGILQQLSIIRLPGDTSAGASIADSILRPSSTTGSYLHYPITLALLAVCMLEISVKRKSTVYLAIAVFEFACVIVSLSRSGTLILLGAVAIYVARLLWRADLASKLVLAVAVGIVAVTGLLASQSAESIFITRILNAADTTAPGNLGRIDAWQGAFEKFSHSNLLVGEYTGLYTNVTANLADTEPSVVESSVLQQLINFGLLGVLSFYLLFISVFIRIDKSCAWLRAGALAAILESAVYQSIEAFPFIIIYSLLPQIAFAIGIAGPEPLKTVTYPVEPASAR